MSSLVARVARACPLWSFAIVVVVTVGAFGTAHGGYPHDVELIEPVTTRNHNNYPNLSNAFRIERQFPSYVKGEDPVEEYNRRRLHVDTSDYLKGIRKFPDDESRKLLEESLRAIKLRYAKREDAGVANLSPKSMRDLGLKTRNNPRRRHPKETVAYRRRFEESDPHVFSYERSEPAGAVDRRQQTKLPEDTKYFQYLNFFGDGSYNAGAKRGNNRHYIEQHERESKGAGVFQKRVKWADKHGGFGEHYWDLNHVSD